MQLSEELQQLMGIAKETGQQLVSNVKKNVQEVVEADNPLEVMGGRLAKGLQEMIPTKENPLGGFGFGGIISAGRKPFTRLNIMDVHDKVKNMNLEDIPNWKINEESRKMLAAKGNPGGATSAFIGPEGRVRLVIDDTASKISQYAFESGLLKKHPDGSIRTKEGIEMKLSDVFLHPSLYEISDLAKDTVVKGKEGFESLFHPTGASYNPTSNLINIGESYRGKGRKQSSPESNKLPYEDTEIDLRHEATHVLQTEQKAGSGSTVDKNRILQELKKADPQSKEEALHVKNAIDAFEKFDTYPSFIQDALIEKAYKSKYGEWEARAGSEYSPTANPILTQPKNLWGSILDENK